MAASKPTAKEATALTDQFFGQVSDSIQMVFDLTSRIDERVKMLMERQREIDGQIVKLIDMQQQVISRLTVLESKDIASVTDDLKDLSEKVAVVISDNPKEDLDIARQERADLRSKVHILEMKLENVNMRLGGHDNRWSKIFDAFWKVALMLIAGYILYKLGIQAPPLD